jgi:subtilisin family serine protease
VAASGNAGGRDPSFPASHPGVISVTATDSGDARYGWATHGDWVTIAAPGCSQAPFPAAGYGEFCGTSSATALVSGVVGLVRSLEGVDASLAYSTVAANAVSVGDFVAAGRVDAAAAVAARPRVTASRQPPADSLPAHHEPHLDPR